MRRIYLAVALYAILSAACSKSSSSSSPTAPTPTPVTKAPDAPAIPQVSSVTIDNMQHRVTMAWNAVAGATSYVVLDSLQTGPGAFDRRQIEVTTTQYVVPDPGTHCVGVTAKNAAGVSLNVGCRVVYVVDMQSALEALFFDRGPYADPERPQNKNVITGWVPGTPVTIRVENLPENERQIVQHVADQYAQVAGAYAFSAVASAPNSNPAVVFPGAIRLFTLPVGQGEQYCNVAERDVPACAGVSSDAGGRIQWARVILSPDTRYPAAFMNAHEVAHALGLFHIYFPAPPTGFDTGLLMQSPLPVIPASELTPMEIEMIRQVFANGFGPGTPRADLVARGLIHP
jgi:hypothetical protein